MLPLLIRSSGQSLVVVVVLPGSNTFQERYKTWGPARCMHARRARRKLQRSEGKCITFRALLSQLISQQQAGTHAHSRWEHLWRRHGHRMDHRFRRLLSQTVQPQAAQQGHRRRRGRTPSERPRAAQRKGYHSARPSRLAWPTSARRTRLSRAEQIASFGRRRQDSSHDLCQRTRQEHGRLPASAWRKPRIASKPSSAASQQFSRQSDTRDNGGSKSTLASFHAYFTIFYV